jgi:uncharacterized phage protein (TIGR02218 family)
VKEIPQTFAEALAQERREVVRAIVVTLAWPTGPTFRFVNYAQGMSLDLRDGAGEVRFDPFPFSLGTVDSQGDLQVDQTTITFPNAELLVQFSSQVQHVTVADIVLNGVLDMATIVLYLANLENGATYKHSVWDVVGSPQVTRNNAGLQLQSALGRCTRRAPKTIIQAGCNNGLFDTWCTLVRASYTTTGSVVSPLTGFLRRGMTVSLGKADDYFALGQVLFVSGRNVGAYRTIGYQKGEEIRWAVPLLYDVEAGDLFEIVPGCDKSHATCATKFLTDNSANYRGMPSVPRPEVMV